MADMKLRYRVGLASIIALALVSAFSIARAADRVTLAANETVNGPFIRAGEKIEIDGTVNGDVIVAGSEVMIRGDVRGNVYAAGSRVEVGGKVQGNTHIAGSEVKYAADSSGSVFAAGSNVRLESEASANTAYLAGSQVNILGEYAGGVYAAGTEIVMGADVARDVSLAGTQLRLTRDAQVGGNLKYTSDREATIENDKAVKGSISRVTPPRQSASERFVARLTETLYWLIANILLAAVLLKFVPSLLKPSEAAYARAPLPNVLKALAFVFLVPVGLVLAAFTIVGLPLVLILGLVYILVLLVAPTAAAYWLGVTIFRWQKAPLSGAYKEELMAASLGILILSIIGLIPGVGGVLSFAAFLIGLAMLLSRDLKPLGWRPASRT